MRLEDYLFMRMLKCALCLAMLGCSLSSLAARVMAQTNPPASNPRLYLSNADVTRLRQQAGIPALAAAYADLETKTERSVNDWLKKYPTTPAPRSTAELVATGKRDNPSPDFRTIATAYALHPTPVLGRVLREKLLAAIGVRQINNYWFDDGIHEGEASMQFLEAYDLASAAGLMTAEDKKSSRKNCGAVRIFCRAGCSTAGGPTSAFPRDIPGTTAACTA